MNEVDKDEKERYVKGSEKRGQRKGKQDLDLVDSKKSENDLERNKEYFAFVVMDFQNSFLMTDLRRNEILILSKESFRSHDEVKEVSRLLIGMEADIDYYF